MTSWSTRWFQSWMAAMGLCLAAGLLAACGPTTSAPPRIVTIVPEQSFVDDPLLLNIAIPGLRPALRVDLNEGTSAADLDSLRMTLLPLDADAGPPAPLQPKYWEDNGSISALTPADLPAGQYALRVEDPRGMQSLTAPAFTSLGQDTIPPTLKLMPDLAPDSILAEGNPTVATLTADDGAGRVLQVHWETSDGTKGDCPTPEEMASAIAMHDPPPSTRPCPVKFSIAPFADQAPPIMPFAFHAWARDVAGNIASLDIPLRVARHPTVTSFSDTVGALGGYQPFVVRGRGFIAGSRALLDGVPIVGTVPGGQVASDALITGWTPPRNRAGAVQVQVVSDGGSGKAPTNFNYVGPPRPRAVEPNRGSRAGGFRVTVSGNDLRAGATVYLGVERNTRQPLTFVQHQTDNKITACVPPGSGTMSLWVYDSVTGDGVLADAFTYDDGNGSGTAGDGGAAAAPAVDFSCK